MTNGGAREAAQRTGPALEAMYQFVLWLVPTVDRFPRRQKFLLGDRLQATALDVLERLVEATYTRSRAPHLAAANLGVEKLRLLCRLAKDLRHLDNRRYAHAARSLDETGRLIGGWRKTHRRKAAERAPATADATPAVEAQFAPPGGAGPPAGREQP